MNLPIEFPLPAVEDVQNTPDTRRLAIDQVGIKGIRHPIRVPESGGALQHTVATINMSVTLPEQFKGTHMSRFIEILNLNEQPVSLAHFRLMLQEMAERLETETGHIEMRFPFFVGKSAPVSGARSLMDYEVSLIGDIHQGASAITLKLLIPVTSLCPCSKKISDYGAHNQRSHVTITARVNQDIAIEELIRVVEQEASGELYGLLKRPDEKYVTEYAYDNPKFVEDMVRDVAARLNADKRIDRYTVECENFESIHNHSAYAVIHGGRAK
ncbi:MAG: GTP cyclohydrolase FolE2 [Methylobacillus sp.]|jgi:GTP cyclohydrolase I|nr:GTP cyclohydrolase FolE2 [Methylobacillus sp.]